MALTREQLQQQYNKAFGPNRVLDDSGFNTYSKFNNPEDVYNDLLKSTEYQLRQDQMKSDLQVNPISDAEYGEFGQKANNLFAPQREASKGRLAAFRGMAEQDSRDLETRLREQATGATKGLEQNLSQRGLLYSGENVAGQSKIQSDLSGNLNRASLQRALADADRVLQESQFNLDVDKQVAGKTQEYADQEYGRRQQKAQVALQGLGLDLSQFDKGMKQAKSSSDLLLDDKFGDLLLDNPELAKQLLSLYGFSVT